MIHVVVGIITNEQGEVLIAQRPAHQYCGGMWEFPGGKIETTETGFDALRREFREEIGIQIITAKSWFQIKHEYPDRVVMLDVWQVEKFLGQPHGAEGQVIRWIPPRQFHEFQFPEGNKEILNKLSQTLT